MLNLHICEVNKQPRADFKAEARYYLAQNDFDFRRARDHYDQDMKYEEEQLKL
jgi:hypothetical protein